MAYDNNYNGGNQGGFNNRPRSMGGNPVPRNSNNRSGSSTTAEVSTQGVVMINNRNSKFLSVNFWSRCASIEIGVCPAGSDMSWNDRKNAQRFNQVIGYNDLCDLQMICEEVMESVKNTGTFSPVGIQVGAKHDAIIEISNGSNINVGPGIYLVLYKNLDQNNRTNSLEFYPFGDVKVLRGYDHTSGISKEDISKIGEFKQFYKAIRKAADALTMATAHVVAANQKNDKLSAFRAMAAMSAALGVDLTSELQEKKTTGSSYNRSGNNNGGGYQKSSYNNNRGGYNNGYNRNNGGYNNAQDNNFKKQQEVLASMDEPVDINLSMAALTNVDVSQFS